jgi:succinate dehydrogenase/fumarate reductase flavoprotein subunit
VATEGPCSHTLLAAAKEGGQHVSDVSVSGALVTEESSDVCDAASDQTEAEEDEAEEAIDELYGPAR